MPRQYERLKKKYGKSQAARIYVGKGKTKKARSARARRLRKK